MCVEKWSHISSDILLWFPISRKARNTSRSHKYPLHNKLRIVHNAGGELQCQMSSLYFFPGSAAILFFPKVMGRWLRWMWGINSECWWNIEKGKQTCVLYFYSRALISTSDKSRCVNQIKETMRLYNNNYYYIIVIHGPAPWGSMQYIICTSGDQRSTHWAVKDELFSRAHRRTLSITGIIVELFEHPLNPDGWCGMEKKKEKKRFRQGGWKGREAYEEGM